MKKILLLLLALNLTPTLAQREIRTNDFTLQGPTKDYCNGYTRPGTTINYWDWRNPNFTIYRFESTGIVSHNVLSPFHIGSYSDTQPNVKHLRFVYDKDYEPSDGWELIYKDFGTANSGTPYPSFALYNRYNGLMRIFFYIVATETHPFQTASIDTSHLIGGDITKKTAVFQLSNPIMKPLIDLTETDYINGVTSINTYRESRGTWLVSEFITSYDPCVCDNPSVIQSEPKLISVSTVSLEMDGTSQTSIVYNGNHTSSADLGLSPLVGAINLTGKVIKKGQATYNNLDKFSHYLDDVLFSTQNTPAQSTTKLPTWLSSVPYIGSAITVLNTVIGGGGAKTISGYSTKYKFHISGDITTNAPYQSTNFFTPGSKHVSFGTTIRPIYDNPLGVFNVISLKIKRKRFEAGNGYGFHSEYSFILTDFKYVVNSTAGIKKQPKKLVAAIYFENQYSSCPNTNLLNANGAPPAHKPVDSRYPYTMFRTPFLPIDCLSDYGVKVVNNGSAYTPYYALSQYHVAYIKVIATLDPIDPNADDIIYVASYFPKVTQERVDNFSEIDDNSFHNINLLDIEQNPSTLGCMNVPPQNSAKVRDYCQSTPIIQFDISTSFDEKEKKLKSVSISPNPVKNIINIEGLSNPVMYSIFDKVGIVRLTGKINPEEPTITISDKLTNGLYILKITDSKNLTSKSIHFIKN